MVREAVSSLPALQGVMHGDLEVIAQDSGGESLLALGL